MKELSEKEHAALSAMVAKAKSRAGKMSDDEKDVDAMDDLHCLAGEVEPKTD